MKTVKFGLFGSILGVLASQASASEQDNTYIQEVQIRDNGVVIAITSSERDLENGSCVDGNWHKTHWAFNPSTTTRYREMLAMLLNAKSTASQVKIVGTGACNAFATIETLQSITIK